MTTGTARPPKVDGEIRVTVNGSSANIEVSGEFSFAGKDLDFGPVGGDIEGNEICVCLPWPIKRRCFRL